MVLLGAIYTRKQKSVAYNHIVEALAKRKRATDIFKFNGNVYAFDSTTILLCLDVFWWAKFRKHNLRGVWWGWPSTKVTTPLPCLPGSPKV